MLLCQGQVVGFEDDVLIGQILAVLLHLGQTLLGVGGSLLVLVTLCFTFQDLILQEDDLHAAGKYSHVQTFTTRMV